MGRRTNRTGMRSRGSDTRPPPPTPLFAFPCLTPSHLLNAVESSIRRRAGMGANGVGRGAAWARRTPRIRGDARAGLFKAAIQAGKSKRITTARELQRAPRLAAKPRGPTLPDPNPQPPRGYREMRRPAQACPQRRGSGGKGITRCSGQEDKAGRERRGHAPSGDARLLS